MMNTLAAGFFCLLSLVLLSALLRPAAAPLYLIAQLFLALHRVGVVTRETLRRMPPIWKAEWDLARYKH